MTKTATTKTEKDILQETLQNAFDSLEKAIKSKSEYIDKVQIIIVNFIKYYNTLLTYNSDILARLVKYIEKINKSDLKKLGAFLQLNTTIKSVSIKEPAKFTTCEYLVKDGKKYKTVNFKEDIDTDNLPLWYDCKFEKVAKSTPIAKKLLSNVKSFLNTVDSIENDTKLLTLVSGIYKQVDNLQKQLEQIINNE